MSESASVLSVAVFGSSVTALVAGDREAGSLHLTYPGALARTEIDGVRFDVRTHARIYGLVTDLAGAWLVLANDRPDIAILEVGFADAFPRISPKFVTKHLLGMRRRSSHVRDIYWRRCRDLLLGIHAAERRIDAHAPLGWSRVPLRRFERELTAVCTKIREQVGCQLVLMTPFVPVHPTPFLNPRLVARTKLFAAAIERVGAAVGADVVSLAQIVQANGAAGSLPDGLHMSVESHRAVADELATRLTCGAALRVA